MSVIHCRFLFNIITVDAENALRDGNGSENDAGDDSDNEPINDINDRLADASEVAQAASMDPGDDGDDGAVDGPPVSSHVDLAGKVGMYLTSTVSGMLFLHFM